MTSDGSRSPKTPAATARRAKVRRAPRPADRPASADDRLDARQPGARQGSRDWRQAVAAPNTPIVEALRILEESRLQILMITDEAQQLLGIVTDGDIRRAILRGDGLDDPIERAMVREPLTTTTNVDRLHLLERIQ